MPDYKEPHL